MPQKAHGFYWPDGFDVEAAARFVRTGDVGKSVHFCSAYRSVVQAGGHIGVWPKYLAKRFEKVFTFEPHWANYLCLCLNVPELNVSKYQLALSERLGMVHLAEIPVQACWYSHALHHIDLGNSTNKKSRHAESLPVGTMRIDDLGLEDCDLIILDVEGAELSALRGAVQTIHRSSPVLHLEVYKDTINRNLGEDTEEDLYAFLTELGYEQVDQLKRDKIYVRK